MAICNRLHIDAENETWRRFPMLCSYCGVKPCACKTIKSNRRVPLKTNTALRPKTLADFQKMFFQIYPPLNRTLPDAGVHLAEETGEVSETIHNFFGQHKISQFDNVKMEVADFISCVFGVANSAGINIAAELEKMFYNNCHVCHETPCVCNFGQVSQLST